MRVGGYIPASLLSSLATRTSPCQRKYTKSIIFKQKQKTTLCGFLISVAGARRYSGYRRGLASFPLAGGADPRHRGLRAGGFVLSERLLPTFRSARGSRSPWPSWTWFCLCRPTGARLVSRRCGWCRRCGWPAGRRTCRTCSPLNLQGSCKWGLPSPVPLSASSLPERPNHTTVILKNCQVH